LLSAKIAALLAEDETLNPFHIEADDPSGELPLVLRLGQGRTIAMTEELRPFLLKIVRELGNRELYQLLLSQGNLNSLLKAFQLRCVIRNSLNRSPVKDSTSSLLISASLDGLP
jgi:hypothetical protein